MDVNNRRLHVQLTQEVEIAPDFFFIRAIFAFAGFVSTLKPPDQSGGPGAPAVSQRWRSIHRNPIPGRR